MAYLTPNPCSTLNTYSSFQQVPRRLVAVFVSAVTATGAGLYMFELPAWAMSFANAETTLTIESFSSFPLAVETFTWFDTEAISGSGRVESSADADADFVIDQLLGTSIAMTSVVSSVEGQNGSYSGFGQGVAQAFGGTFSVDTDETFSFNFNATLEANASVDAPEVEQATATSEVFWGLYNNEGFDPSNFVDTIPIAFLSISNTLDTLGQNIEPIVEFSSGVTFKTNTVFLSPIALDPQASAIAKGSFSQTFSSPTTFTLVASTANRSASSRIDNDSTGTAVPEPSMTLALLLLAGGGGLKSWMTKRQ